MNKKRLFIIGFLAVASTMFLFLNSTFAKETFTPKDVTYDELREGDVIPFDSMLSMDAFFPIGESFHTSYDDWRELYKTGGYVHWKKDDIKLYYCKDESCLESKKYDKEKTIIAAPTEEIETIFSDKTILIFQGSSEINVSNYQTIFEEGDDSYVGWKVHFVDSGVLFYWFDHGSMEDNSSDRVGNYQHIVLTPVRKADCDCEDDEDAESEYYLEQEIDITASSWYFKNAKHDYVHLYEDVDTTSWQKPASFTFEANKGDKLVVKLKMDTVNLKITLDGKEQKLLDEFYDDEEKLTANKVNPNRYYELEYEILDDGQHTFTIEYLGDTDLYFPYIYMAELKVLKPVQIEEVSKGKVLEIRTCQNGFQMRIDHEIGMESEEKPDVPNTGDNGLNNIIILGMGVTIIGFSILCRRKVNS